jgi:hypothetical protein
MTFLPDRSRARASASVADMSGAIAGKKSTASASRSISDWASVVARTPNGSMPAITPASTPSLGSVHTRHPTSSRSGWAATARIKDWPLRPAPHWITRIGTIAPSS